MELARGTNRPSILCRAACTGLLRPANDKALTEACLTFARRAMELGKADEKVLPRCQMVLGMALFRTGSYDKADEALAAAAAPGNGDPLLAATCDLYRAMSRFRQGKPIGGPALWRPRQRRS